MATTGFKFITLTLVNSQGKETKQYLNINPDYIVGYDRVERLDYTIIYTNISGNPQYRVVETPETIEESANA